MISGTLKFNFHPPQPEVFQLRSCQNVFFCLENAAIATISDKLGDFWCCRKGVGVVGVISDVTKCGFGVKSCWWEGNALQQIQSQPSFSRFTPFPEPGERFFHYLLSIIITGQWKRNSPSRQRERHWKNESLLAKNNIKYLRFCLWILISHRGKIKSHILGVTLCHSWKSEILCSVLWPIRDILMGMWWQSQAFPIKSQKTKIQNILDM